MKIITLQYVDQPHLLHLEMGSSPQWFSKCGPWASSVSITWKLVRNANSQAFPQT